MSSEYVSRGGKSPSKNEWKILTTRFDSLKNNISYRFRKNILIQKELFSKLELIITNYDSDYINNKIFPDLLRRPIFITDKQLIDTSTANSFEEFIELNNFRPLNSLEDNEELYSCIKFLNHEDHYKDTFMSYIELGSDRFYDTKVKEFKETNESNRSAYWRLFTYYFREEFMNEPIYDLIQYLTDTKVNNDEDIILRIVIPYCVVISIKKINPIPIRNIEASLSVFF